MREEWDHEPAIEALRSQNFRRGGRVDSDSLLLDILHCRVIATDDVTTIAIGMRR